MNDRFLFKGLRVDNNEWVIGYYYKEYDNVYIIEDRQKKSELTRNHPYQVIPETVCQCTGLKDKNRKLIFENDEYRISTKL